MVNVSCPKCPNCGAPVKTSSNECEYCGSAIIISSFSGAMWLPDLSKYTSAYKNALTSSPNDPSLNAAVGFCYMRLKMYSNALESFKRAIDGGVMNSEVFFWAGVCSLGGKKAFLSNRAAIDRAEEYVNAARAVEDRGIYAYFDAYIRYDYFKRKSLIARPDYRELLNEAVRLGVSEHDIGILFDLLRVERPNEL